MGVVVLIVLFPMFLLAAAAVRFAGNSPALLNVEYERVNDPKALHRWAGNLLGTLPIVCALVIALLYFKVIPASLGLAVVGAWFGVTLLWVFAGLGRFHDRT